MNALKICEIAASLSLLERSTLALESSNLRAERITANRFTLVTHRNMSRPGPSVANMDLKSS